MSDAPDLPRSLRDKDASSRLLAYDSFYRVHPWPAPFDVTTQLGARGDARQLPIPDDSAGLVLTHPPYHDLKSFHSDAGGRQLGHRPDYERFLDDLDDVWREAFRVLHPGGRVCCVVGNVLRSAARHGRHEVLPLPHDIIARARRLGFEVMTPLQWHKVANRRGDRTGNRAFLGTPFQPNGAVSANHEYVISLRKPGHRRVSMEARGLSVIQPSERERWLQPYWTDVAGVGAAIDHPAPFPEIIAYRLIRLFSFAGDWVVDPFAGAGTTLAAARKAGRNAFGLDVVQTYARRLRSTADGNGHLDGQNGHMPGVAESDAVSATAGPRIYCLDRPDGHWPGRGKIVQRTGHDIADVQRELSSQDVLWLHDIWDHVDNLAVLHRILRAAVDANTHFCAVVQNIDTRTDDGAARLAGFLSLTDRPDAAPGRKRKLDRAALARARELRAAGLTVTEIARRLNVHRATLHRRL
jgi:site-specific DNA-methyltransferase (adenine-specific)